ncbi:MAG TPA: ATP-binding protein [Gemmatimonadaceae bacterium]|nr:ATP-binding protein [Gemmatimonadaceae bacterium]
MPSVPLPRVRRFALAAQLLCLGILILATGILGAAVGRVVGSLLLLAALVALAAAAAFGVQYAAGTRRDILLGIAFGTFCAVLAQLHNTVRYVLLGATPEFPSPGLLLLIFGAHPCLIAAYAAGLGWSRRAWQRSSSRLPAALDVLLIGCAATIVGIQITYLARWPVENLDGTGRALVLFWRCLPFVEVVLVVLLLSARGRLLGRRMGVGLAVATLAFAIANLSHGRLALVSQTAAVTSNDVLWAISTFAFAVAVAGGPGWRIPAADTPAVTLGSSRLRSPLLVAAILIAALSTLVIGFRDQPSPELATAVAVFGVLLAVRGGQALVAHQRTAERLVNRVAAERALTTTLEHRVGERTRELAEAQRVLQRMWALGQHVTQELHPGRVVERFMEAVSDVAKVDGAALALRVDADTLRLTSMLGAGANLIGLAIPIEGSIMGRVVRTGRSWCSGDITAEPREEGSYSVFDGYARALAVVPLHQRGECIGALTVVTRAPRTWLVDELSRIEAMADLLSVALANAEAVAELRKAERRFRTLFRAAPDMVVTVHPSGRIVEANDCTRDVLGVEPVEVVGRELGDFVAPEDRCALDLAITAALADHADRADRVEVRVPSRGGTRHVAIALSRLAETDPPTVLLIARDITREREMRARLVETERLAAVGELVAGVAHEVNNPLSSISAFAQLLLRDETIAAEHRESVEVIHGETLRAAQVVKDLLAFARRSAPRREPVDLNQLVERTLRLRGYQLSSSGVRLDLDLPAALPPVLGDGRQLQQVVLNLITNSIQAMEGEPNAMLRLATRRDDEQVVLEIEDNGPGIPAEARARVFEPFFTTKEEGEGTGLGLSVSYGIVAAHDGVLELVQTSERGTCFRVTLPAASADLADVAATTSPTGESRSPLAGMRVLFVDDEPSLRQGMEAFGRLRGFTVVTAADAEGALHALESTSFDALVCDLRMPEMDGWTLHEKVRQCRPGLATRTVFVTGDTITSTTRAPQHGRPAMVAKPFRFEYLEETVHAVLRGRGG